MNIITDKIDVLHQAQVCSECKSEEGPWANFDEAGTFFNLCQRCLLTALRALLDPQTPTDNEDNEIARLNAVIKTKNYEWAELLAQFTDAQAENAELKETIVLLATKIHQEGATND